jgi:uncharacterized protein with von Willebrand factor type A (vWA) domain
MDILHTYGRDYKCVFVGDAAMSPYEIAYAGGASEHWNEEPGHVWLKRALDQWPSTVWLNPVPEAHWNYTHSTKMIREIFADRMFPLTLKGLEAAMKDLSR